jgi:hypothetical protein
LTLKHKQAAQLPFEMEQAFDVTLSYFINKGYVIIDQSRPTSMKVKGGSSFWAASKPMEFPRTLSIAIEKNLPKGCMINCEYELSVWSYPGTWEEFDIEVNNLTQLGTMISANNSTPVQKSTEKIIERQIVKVKCRYCGTLNNDGNCTCESCGARL